MSSQIDPDTARAAHGVIKWPAIVIMAIFWFGLATPIFLVRFIGVLLYNLFRMTVQNYEKSTSSEPMRGLVYFSALYPTITGRIFRSIWVWNPELEEERPTGLHFWGEFVFFTVTAIFVTFINYRKDVFGGIFYTFGSKISSTSIDSPPNFVFGLYAIASAISIGALFIQEARENTAFQIASMLVILASGAMVFFSIFGWP